MADRWPALDLIDPPAYVYQLDEVRTAYRLLRSALPQPSTLLYSLKANPHPALVRTLAEQGCGAEICSTGELVAALDAGLASRRLLYTGPGKRDIEVVEAVKAGVRWFSVDSPSGLRQVDSTARRLGVRAQCLLRINDAATVPGQGLAMTGSASQFGSDTDWICAEPAAFTLPPVVDAGAELAGFHVYQGSNLDREDAVLAQFEVAIAACRRVADGLGVRPRVLDLGGGFGAPFARSGQLPSFTTLASRLALLLEQNFPGWAAGRPRIVFESGRYLAGSCGMLLTRVADAKHSHGQQVVVLESGIHHLGGMSGLRRIPQMVPELILAQDRARHSNTIVTGPLCTPLDTWARSAELPELHRGDLVGVPNVGAYGLTASLLAFLGHPAPVEAVIDGDRLVELSRLEWTRRPAGPAPEPHLSREDS
ncbi:MAG: type III PLP-dependent enzyme [Jatrophihabitans sp.]